MMAIMLAGAPYKFENYKARTRSVYVNKNLIGMYRGVGMPLACVASELLTDLAADKLGLDTVEFKRRNYWPKASLPCTTPTGQKLETVSFHECLEKLVRLMGYDALREASTAASALRPSASRLPMVRPTTAHPAHPSPRKTAAPCGSNRRARCAASPASPTRARVH
jgi:CO/xanthine dehydrogenase Mo-binding subunit